MDFLRRHGLILQLLGRNGTVLELRSRHSAICDLLGCYGTVRQFRRCYSALSDQWIRIGAREVTAGSSADAQVLIKIHIYRRRHPGLAHRIPDQSITGRGTGSAEFRRINSLHGNVNQRRTNLRHLD